MALNDFLKGFQNFKSKKNKKQPEHPLLPVSFMVKLQAPDDSSNTVEILDALQHVTRFPHPDEEIYVPDDNDESHATLYLSIYGFELLAQELKRCILNQTPLDKETGSEFTNIDVNLVLMENQFQAGNKDDDGKFQFQGTQIRADFDHVTLQSNFINATYFLYRLLFFSYTAEDFDDMDTEDEYQSLNRLAKDIKINYTQQNKVDNDRLATIPNYQDFEKQDHQGVFIPALSYPTGDHSDNHPNQEADDTDSYDDGDSNHPHDGDQDPAQSLIDDGQGNESSTASESGDHENDNTTTVKNDDTPGDATDHDEQDDPANDDRKDTPDNKDNSESSNTGEAKTIGEIRKEQEAQQGSDTDSGNDNNNQHLDNRDESPADIIKNIYAPHLYKMNVDFPQFTVDQKMGEPPKLEEAVKHNDFEDQLYIVQETNRMRKQANSYLQQEAQQVNRNFNFEMGQIVMRVYKQLNDKISEIRNKGQNDQKLNKSVQEYYEQQSHKAFDQLKQNKDYSLDQRLEALKKEYEQKKKDLIAQSDQEYENNRTQTNSRIQSDAEKMRNDNIERRDKALHEQIQQSKRQAEEYLSHHLQNKADRYKDMADNLGQRLFTALQNNLNAEYPKLVDHVARLMNEQSQFNYSNKRLNESKDNVANKRLNDYKKKLQQALQEQTDSDEEYKDRINSLQQRLDKRDDTSKKYDQALTEKNDLQDHIDHLQSQIKNLQDSNSQLKQQLEDAPLGQPDMTAKDRSVELNYQSLQNDYQQLKEINNEHKNQLTDLQAELDRRKHFWEKK